MSDESGELVPTASPAAIAIGLESEAPRNSNPCQCQSQSQQHNGKHVVRLWIDETEISQLNSSEKLSPNPFTSPVPPPPFVPSCCSCWFPLRHPRAHLNEPREYEHDGHQYPQWRGNYYASGEPKSVLRGVFHEIVFFLVLPIYTILLLMHCKNVHAYLASIIFLIAQFVLYGVSSQLHRRQWSLPHYNLMRQLDHSAIFLLSASSSAPCAVMLIRSKENGVDNSHLVIAGWILVAWAWGVTIIGIIHTFLQPSTSRKVSTLGLVLMGLNGACVFPFFYPMFLVMNSLEWYSICIGWFFLGAAICTYRFHAGDFSPSIFGYHESFHLLAIAAAICIAIFNYSMMARLE